MEVHHEISAWLRAGRYTPAELEEALRSLESMLREHGTPQREAFLEVDGSLVRVRLELNPSQGGK